MTRKKQPKNHFSLVFIFLLVILAVLQIFFANSLSVQGKEISRLESLRSDLEEEIEFLKQKSSELASLESVRTLAREKLKMEEGNDHFDYFDLSVALR